MFVSYDANAQRLYFNDGSFWYMGAESGGTEFDAGVRYPTLMSGFATVIRSESLSDRGRIRRLPIRVRELRRSRM